MGMTDYSPPPPWPALRKRSAAPNSNRRPTRETNRHNYTAQGNGSGVTSRGRASVAANRPSSASLPPPKPSPPTPSPPAPPSRNVPRLFSRTASSLSTSPVNSNGSSPESNRLRRHSSLGRIPNRKQLPARDLGGRRATSSSLSFRQGASTTVTGFAQRGRSPPRPRGDDARGRRVGVSEGSIGSRQLKPQQKERLEHGRSFQRKEGERERGTRPRRRRRLVWEMVVYQAAEDAVEDLIMATPVLHGLALLSCAFAASASRGALFVSLWSVVLGLGTNLWLRATVPNNRSAKLWRESKEGKEDEKEKEKEERMDNEAVINRGGVGWISLTRTVRGVLMTLACLPSLLEVASQYCFVLLAARTENMRLALMLTIASLLHPALVWITARRKGAKEPGNGLIKRYLAVCWRVLFLFGGVTHSLQWDATFVRQGLGCLLLKSAARQLSMVTAGEVEESVRYGLLAALDRVFRGMDELELPAIVPALTLGRWFLDNWSKRPSLSGQELRDKLFETAASISRDESVRDLVSEGEGDDTAFVAALRASLERSTANQSLSARLDAAVKTVTPGRTLAEVFLILRACPTSCGLPLLLSWMWHRPPLTWAGVAFLLVLLGPVVVESWRLKVLWGELYGKHGEETDGLALIFKNSNPALSQVWANVQQTAQHLREDPVLGGHANPEAETAPAAIGEIFAGGVSHRDSATDNSQSSTGNESLGSTKSGVGTSTLGRVGDPSSDGDAAANDLGEIFDKIGADGIAVLENRRESEAPPCHGEQSAASGASGSSAGLGASLADTGWGGDIVSAEGVGVEVNVGASGNTPPRSLSRRGDQSGADESSSVVSPDVAESMEVRDPAATAAATASARTLATASSKGSVRGRLGEAFTDDRDSVDGNERAPPEVEPMAVAARLAASGIVPHCAALPVLAGPYARKSLPAPSPPISPQSSAASESKDDADHEVVEVPEQRTGSESEVAIEISDNPVEGIPDSGVTVSGTPTASAPPTTTPPAPLVSNDASGAAAQAPAVATPKHGGGWIWGAGDMIVGTTWAMVETAGGVAGAVGDAAGDPVGSVVGVFEWWMGGTGNGDSIAQKEEEDKKQMDSPEASSAEKGVKSSSEENGTLVGGQTDADVPAVPDVPEVPDVSDVPDGDAETAVDTSFAVNEYSGYRDDRGKTPARGTIDSVLATIGDKYRREIAVERETDGMDLDTRASKFGRVGSSDFSRAESPSPLGGIYASSPLVSYSSRGWKGIARKVRPRDGEGKRCASYSDGVDDEGIISDRADNERRRGEVTLGGEACAPARGIGVDIAWNAREQQQRIATSCTAVLHEMSPNETLTGTPKGTTDDVRGGVTDEGKKDGNGTITPDAASPFSLFHSEGRATSVDVLADKSANDGEDGVSGEGRSGGTHAEVKDAPRKEEQAGLLSGIASWTISNAAAFAGGAAVVLLSSFHKEKKGGKGEEKQGSATDEKAIGAEGGASSVNESSSDAAALPVNSES